MPVLCGDHQEGRTQVQALWICFGNTFTISEQVAIAAALAETLQGRVGTNQHAKRGSGNISLPSDVGQTRDIAAAKAGLGSGKTLEAAQRVLESGSKKLVDAMDSEQAELTP